MKTTILLLPIIIGNVFYINKQLFVDLGTENQKLMTEDYISKFYEQSLNQPIPYRKGNVWGYSNIWGDILIEPQYQEAGFFYQAVFTDLESYRAVVKQNGRYFIIDNHNNQLSKNYKKIDVIDPYNNENAYFEVYSNTGKSGVFFKNRLIADTQYDEIEPCETHIKTRQSDKYGLMDYEGTLVIPSLALVCDECRKI